MKNCFATRVRPRHGSVQRTRLHCGIRPACQPSCTYRFLFLLAWLSLLRLRFQGVGCSELTVINAVQMRASGYVYFCVCVGIVHI